MWLDARNVVDLGFHVGEEGNVNGKCDQSNGGREE